MNEVREKKIVLIDGFKGASIGIKTTQEYIQFWSEDLGALVTNPLVTDTGETVGDRNRAQLHTLLNEWLDKTWQES
jgi:hypothetical protein